MLQDKKAAGTAIFILSALFLGFALFSNLPLLHQPWVFADQAIYFAMAQSLAFDGDLEYTARDLIRYEEDMRSSPNGIFLKKVVREDQERYYYAKSYAYALLAAPFVRVFGPNGPLVLNGLLLFLLLVMGWNYFSLANSPGLALVKMVTFLGASVAGVYAFWITPDFFNLFLVFTVLFLWRFKIKAKSEPAGGTSAMEPAERPGPWRRFLLSGAADYLAAIVAGIVVYSKPTNILLTAPLVLSTWLVGKKFWKAAAMGFVLVLTAAVFFGANWLWTGDWNYQGGLRASFVYHFPLEKKGVTFDAAAGNPMTADGYVGRSIYPVKFIPSNLFWYFFGRFTGLAWYFFPALLYLILFFMGKKSLDRWLILAAAAGQILVYIYMMPQNYGGGGGSLANRYFMSIYPLFLFLPAIKIRPKAETILPWAMAAVFLSPILLSPLQTSSSPSMHAKKFPFTLLPLEYTLINDLPTNTTPSAHRQRWGTPLFEDRFLYFLDDNTNPKQRRENGWWTYGDQKADMVLRTFFPVKEVIVHLLNNPRRDNLITVTLDGKTQSIVLDSFQKGTLRFTVGDGFVILVSHQYRFKVKAAKGSLPYHEIEASDELRHLGVFFELELIPR